MQVEITNKLKRWEIVMGNASENHQQAKKMGNASENH